MPFLPSFPEKTNLSDVFKAFPKGIKPLMEYHDEVLRGPSPLTIGEREMIAAFVSKLNGCRFCFNSHQVYAAFYGVDETLFDRLIEDIDTSGAPDKMKPVLKYARKITLDHGNIGQADSKAILKAGWPEAAVYDTAAVSSLFNYMNRIVDAMGVDSQDDVYAARLNAVLKKPLAARLAQNKKDIGKANYVQYGKSLGLID